MSSHLDYVMDYAPTLAPIAARLLDGADGRIYVASAGPQPGTKFYDPSEPPYFSFRLSPVSSPRRTPSSA